MAVVTTKSGPITNRDATPQVKNSSQVEGGLLRESVGTAEAANGDSIASKYIMASVPSNARISQVLLSCDAITTCAGDVGVYRSTADGGAVVDADFFASAQSLAVALVNSDVTHEADAADAGSGFGLADTEKPLWQALGLTSDPGVMYDIAVTLTAAAGSAGTISAKVRYAV